MLIIFIKKYFSKNSSLQQMPYSSAFVLFFPEQILQLLNKLDINCILTLIHILYHVYFHFGKHSITSGNFLIYLYIYPTKIPRLMAHIYLFNHKKNKQIKQTRSRDLIIHSQKVIFNLTILQHHYNSPGLKCPLIHYFLHEIENGVILNKIP